MPAGVPPRTGIGAATADIPVPRGERARESLRRASECALVGVLFLLFSLPVVTSGAAWLAVARVCVAWARGVEPPLLRTFISIVRHRLLTGLALQAVGCAVAALPYLEARVALASRLPGAKLEAALLAVLAAGALAVVLLSVPIAAARDLRAPAAIRASVSLVRAAPWAAGAAVAALAAGVAVVALLPVLGAVMAGPVGFAISAVSVRAEDKVGRRDGGDRAGDGTG